MMLQLREVTGPRTHRLVQRGSSQFTNLGPKFSLVFTEQRKALIEGKKYKEQS